MTQNSLAPSASPNGYRIEAEIMWKLVKSREVALINEHLLDFH